MRHALVVVQCVTFLWLGGLLAADGSWQLGAAQWLLAGVNALVYW